MVKINGGTKMSERRSKTTITTTTCKNCCKTVHFEDVFDLNATQNATTVTDAFIQNEKGENIPNPKYNTLGERVNED